MEDVLAAARNILEAFLEGKENRRETLHPWRKGWEFALMHSYRVEAYVERILAREPHSLSADEVLTLRLAAILHDICRLEDKEQHAQLGAEVVAQWLEATPAVAAQIPDREKLISLIAGHSAKGGPEPDFCHAVLKDADILDEIGVFSVFMAANWLDKQSPFFFHELRERLEGRELAFCDRQLARLKTEGARQILAEKRRFIETVIAQLTDELDGTLDL